MTKDAEYKNVKLSNLIVYSENPRHKRATSEYEAMKLLWKNKRNSEKMMNLAKDIAANGLSPVETLAVVPANDKNGKYLVYDRNRRVTALKVLLDPSKYDFLTSNQKKILQKAVKNSSRDLPKTIRVYVTDEESAFALMKRLHLGDNNGRGRHAWGPLEKDRFDVLTGAEKDEILILLEKAEEYFDTELLEVLPLTNLRRMFYAPIKKALQIDKKNPESFTKDRVALAIKLVEVAAAEEKKSGNKVSRWHVNDALRILYPIIQEEVSKHPLSSIPKPPISNDTENEILQVDDTKESQKNDSVIKDKEEITKPQVKSKPAKTKGGNEPYFMEGLDLSILSSDRVDTQGIICIGNDLITITNKRLVNELPYASAFLLRVFIEAVLVQYLKSRRNVEGKPYWSQLAKETKGNPNLSSVINYYNKHLQDGQLLPPEQKRTFEKTVSNVNDIIEPINLMVHHPEKYREPDYRIKDWPKLGILSLMKYMIEFISGQNGG